MIVSTAKEIKRLRRSGKVVRAALDAMAKAVRPGITTVELNLIGAQILKENGARSGPPRVYQYPGDVCISINEQALHGIPSKRVVMAGDIVKLDLVAELHGSYTDAAVTVVVPCEHEVINSINQRLKECAELAFQAGLAVVAPGVAVTDIGTAIEAVTKTYGFELLQGFGGHGIGKTIHETPFIPNYYIHEMRKNLLEEGMVITIEPIIAEFSGESHKCSDGWTIVTKDGGRTSHFEHTFIVQKDGPLILTA